MMHPLTAAPDRSTAAILQDIAQHLQILPNLSISHPDYGAVELPEDISTHLLTLPIEYQHKYLQGQLRNYLYDLYFSGELLRQPRSIGLITQSQPVSWRESTWNNHPSGSEPVLQNNTVYGMDWDFYQQIDRANQGQGFFDPGWQVVDRQRRGWSVTKAGLTLQIRARHLPLAARSSQIGEQVSIRLPKYQWDAEGYIAIGNQGVPRSDRPIVQVYGNLTATGAIELMRLITSQLNALKCRFSLRLLADPVAYGRYHASLLRFEKSDYPQIQAILTAVYRLLQAQYQSAIPAFTRWLAPGLGLAEEPIEPFGAISQSDFGRHRCQIIATALIAAQFQSQFPSPSRCQDQTPLTVKTRLQWITQQAIQQGVDWQRPYLNPGSEDLYTPIEM